MESGSFELAQARVHARHGQRLDEAGWRAIELLRDFAPVLERARASALRPWLAGIAAESAPAQIEAALRGHWLGLVDEVQGWVPRPWWPPVAWCAVLPDLAPLQHLARGEAPAPWLGDDPRWRALCLAAAPARPALLAAGPWAALAPAWGAPATLGAAWLAEWRRRLPQQRGDAAAALAELAQAVLEHRGAFAAASAERGWLLRTALRERLSRLLRRAALGPAVVFAHLGLCALDLERLRAELLRRSVFPRWSMV